MVGSNVKAETMKLMDRRALMETEMNIIIERLCQPGGPGLSGNLVDSEGFPRSDIDIPAVRASRHRLAELRSDHKEITGKINQNIQVLHSGRLASSTVPVKSSGTNTQDGDISTWTSQIPIPIEAFSNAMEVDVFATKAFAIVDEISEASPAAEDGLQLGDQIVKFGSVQLGDSLLQRLAEEAQKNRGQAVSLVVMRQGELINITVTPRVWSGRGLLGCHFRML